MTVMELMRACKLSPNKFYLLRTAGVIPAPQSGPTVRKWYSPEEVREIEKRLKAAGQLKVPAIK